MLVRVEVIQHTVIYLTSFYVSVLIIPLIPLQLLQVTNRIICCNN